MIGLLLTLLAAADTVQIRSSLDGSMQPALAWLPDEPGTLVPLVVYLHNWSAHYNNGTDLDIAIAEAKRLRWAFIAPEFRGPNDRPEACASGLAVADVLDAVKWARSHVPVDPRRIYLAGVSGGGHMALVMAARAPELWAAASAWVGISDLTQWHAFSKSKGARYTAMIEACCGGPPSPSTAAEYRKRSPLFSLDKAKGLPIDVNTGIRDGHDGSVPVRQSLEAFNALAEPAKKIAEADIEFTTKNAKLPPKLAAERVDEPWRKKAVLFRRESGAARITIFDGGHEGDFPAAFRWLAAQARPPL